MRWIAVLVLLSALVSVGCGGGSKKATTQPAAQRSSRPAERRQFIEVGDSICSNHQSRREDLESRARDLGPLTTPAKARRVAALLRSEADNLRAEAHELAERRPPPEGHSQAERLFATVRARAGAVDRWAGAYETGNEGAIRRGQIQVGLLTAESERRARVYGFLVCGR